MRRVNALAAGSAGLYGAYLASDAQRRQRAAAMAQASWRAARLAAVACVIAVDYKAVQWQARATSQDAHAAAHTRFTQAEEELEVADRAAKVAEAALAQAIARDAPAAERRALQREAKSKMDVAAAKAEVMVASKREASVSAHEEMWRRAHLRSAQRLLWLARENKGVYIKLAQHLSQMDYLLPDEYTSTLRSCLDDAPRSSWEDVCETVREELGGHPEEIFGAFEREPIASASLAQVHMATLRGEGREPAQRLAVKVQHRGLRETATGDVDAVSLAVKALSTLFPHMPLWWVADELAPNLPIELDFCHEAQNAERCRGMFAGDSRIVVPEVLHDLTTPRVLCMSFEEGCTSTDIEALKAMGVQSGKVAALISEVFCKQIFIHKFVHCDPHPANILVRRMPGRGGGGAPQLVILDHGLYRELDEGFVRDYSLLWRALVFGDVQMIRRQCQTFGAGEMYPLLAAMLTARPWNNIIDADRDALRAPDTEEEKHKIKTYAAKYAVDITAIMNKVPRQMLLLFKANDCLRHLDRRLGSPVNTLHITARISNMSIAADAGRGGWGGWARGMADSCRVELTLFGWWLLSRYGWILRPRQQAAN